MRDALHDYRAVNKCSFHTVLVIFLRSASLNIKMKILVSTIIIPMFYYRCSSPLDLVLTKDVPNGSFS